MKKLLTLFCVFLFVHTTYAKTPADKKSVKKIRWMLIHEPIGVFERAVKKFSDTVRTETDGRVEIQMLGSLKNRRKVNINATTALASMQSGEFEMMQVITSFLGNLNEKYWIFDLPFLFRDHEHAISVLDGQIGRDLLTDLRSSNLEGLGFTYSGGFRIIPSAKHEFRNLSDFKGLAICTSESPVASMFFKNLGAKTLGNCLGDRTSDYFDGVESTWVRFWESDVRVNKIINDTGHSLYLTAIIINKNFLESLTPHDQNVVRRAAQMAAEIERDDSLAGSESVKKKLTGDYKVITLSNEERDKLVVASKAVYDNFKNIYGHGPLIEKIRSFKGK